MAVYNNTDNMSGLATYTKTQSLDDNSMAGLDSQRYAHFEAMVADLNGRLAEGTQQLGAYSAELKQRESEIASHKQMLAATKSALDTKSRDLQMVQLQLEQTRTYLNTNNQKLESMAATHANELRKVRVEQKKRTKAAQSIREGKEKLEKRLKEALAENEDLKKQLKQALLEKEEAEGDMMDMVEMDLKYEMERADRIKAEERLQSSLLERGDMVTRTNKLKAEKEALDQKYQALQSTVHLIESRGKLHFKKLQASVKETQALKAQISSLVRDQDEGLTAKVSKLEAELHKSTNARRHMEAARLAVNRADASRKVAEKKVADLQVKFELFRTTSATNSEKERQQATHYIARLRSQCATMKKERDELECQVKALRSDVATEPPVDQVAKIGAATLRSSGSLRAALGNVENSPCIC